MSKEIFVEKIECIKFIEDTEDVKFLINGKINLYVNVERNAITLTFLYKIKTPFKILLDENDYCTEKTIPSSCNFEIIINHSDFKIEDYLRTPSIIVKGKRNQEVMEKVIKEGFRINIGDTITKIDTDYNEVGIKELIEFNLKNRVN